MSLHDHPTRIGVGTSLHRDPRRAGREAAEAALHQAGLDRADSAILFSTVGYPQERVLAAVSAALPGADVFGCSGVGIISQGLSNESNHAVGVMVWSSTRDRLRTASARGVLADSRAAGREVSAKLGRLPDDTVAVLVLADGLNINFDQLVAGMRENWGSLPLLVGGSAGDNWQLNQTWQYHGGEVFTDGVVCAVLTGELTLHTGITHGCQPIGTSHVITKAQGNLVLELDGRPVFDVLEEYLDEEELRDFTKAVINLSLGFETPKEASDDYDEFVIRYMPSKDDELGAVRIPTEVTAGTRVWMTRRDPEKMHAGIERLGAELRNSMGNGRARAVLHFDCAGRGRQMFRESEKARLITRLQEVVDPTVPWLGMYSFGEIGPVRGETWFHNYTAVIAALQ